MSVDIMFNKAQALASGITIRTLRNATDEDIASATEHGEFDEEYLSWMAESPLHLRVPFVGGNHYVLLGEGTSLPAGAEDKLENYVAVYIVSSRTHRESLLVWFTYANIEWSEQ